MKKLNLYLSGSRFAMAKECPASLTINFSDKLMANDRTADAGTDEHAKIAESLTGGSETDIVSRFLPEKSPGDREFIDGTRFRSTYKNFRLSGGPDYALYKTRENELHVIDWKTGPRGIDHLGPSQLLFYAFLICKNEKIKPGEIFLSLVSPRLNQKKTFTVSYDELMDITADFDAIHDAISAAEPPRPGEHCRYCPKRYVCPQFRAELKRFADPTIKGGKLTADDLRTLSIAAAAIADIRAYAMNLIENGAGIPGTRIEYQNAARVFTEEVDAKLLSRRLKVPIETLIDVKLRSPATLEKSGLDLGKIRDLIGITQRKTLKIDKEETKSMAKKKATKKKTDKK